MNWQHQQTHSLYLTQPTHSLERTPQENIAFIWLCYSVPFHIQTSIMAVQISSVVVTVIPNQSINVFAIFLWAADIRLLPTRRTKEQEGRTRCMSTQTTPKKTKNICIQDPFFFPSHVGLCRLHLTIGSYLGFMLTGLQLKACIKTHKACLFYCIHTMAPESEDSRRRSGKTKDERG